MNEKQPPKKLRKILSVSERVKLEMVRQALGLDQRTFSKKIFDWAEEFGFKIDGEYLTLLAAKWTASSTIWNHSSKRGRLMRAQIKLS